MFMLLWVTSSPGRKVTGGTRASTVISKESNYGLEEVVIAKD